VDLVYPGVCCACGSACGGGEFLCLGCGAQLDHLASESACPRCARPVVSTGAPCPWCRGRGLYPFDKIVRLGKFVDPLKKLIHQMKYHRRWGLAELLTDRLLAEERTKNLLERADVILPVPLHWSRQIGRGYNQAAVMAEVLSHRCKLKLLHPIKRTVNTASQTVAHSATARHENVKDAFGPAKAAGIVDRHVIVVDDVMTTAATLQAVGRSLKAAKPASLNAIILAVADPKYADFELI
jgi:ComF family protein